jgi:hypothetical protein
MDVNVKNIAPEVLKRLAEQAEAEGMSQQEWIRQTLRRSSSRLSPAELLARRSSGVVMTEKEYTAIAGRARKRRRAAVKGLGARQRRS